ncbi:OTU deubiquitinase with linear linkage specificity a [Limanda limanda]|uniref:OTU deubiquitinase with linear linkage specificity a n=1 Tax=Limanda limanda TaxID=27771 RepID=UPI0029C7188C|nr:OTU deubiquitinase with linear linkage specificity a [Limanda limanda]
MSWLKAASLRSEDVFDEAGDEMKLQSREWSSNMNKRVKDGYVDGVNAGEDEALQVGFNQGFREGAARTAAVGRLKGIISAVWCWCQIEHPETPVPARVTELLQRVSQHEDRIADGIRKSLENPPPSVSDVSESMEDLEVKQADPSCCGDGGCGEGTDCCSRGDTMDQDFPQRPPRLCSGSASRSSSSDEDLSLLLQSCRDLVSELELPQELLTHIQELKDI